MTMDFERLIKGLAKKTGPYSKAPAHIRICKDKDGSFFGRGSANAYYDRLFKVDDLLHHRMSSFGDDNVFSNLRLYCDGVLDAEAMIVGEEHDSDKDVGNVWLIMSDAVRG